ncbi:LEA type 2 family protein [Hyalangium rubrum]|uniref:LEA type 2 family protein n=1 Tax=Hyalangium rubrum TaxID=3103134 RepID=A0ABU5GZC6_9BACT|nr:LEA type 2 family protein [Hyalangium sp. s54d21]MDY7226551.1 LEA type 2 family protein [Hyalangium sp. s54d21]
MKPSTLSPCLAVALFSCLWLGCASAPSRPENPPTLALQETTVASQGLTDATVRYAGQVVSPSPGVLEKADYELVSDGQVVKTGTAALNVPLTAGQPTAFSFEERAAYVRGSEDLKAMSERGGTLLMALRGTLTVRSGQTVETLPFAASRAVRVPRLPEVVVESLDAARYSAEEVNLTLRLGVKNPNPFPLRLEGLRYTLSVAGKPLDEGTLAKADTVDASATGVYPLEASVTAATLGPEAKALIAKGTLPYQVKGEVKGPLLSLPYTLEGSVKLNVSR